MFFILLHEMPVPLQQHQYHCQKVPCNMLLDRSWQTWKQLGKHIAFTFITSSMPALESVPKILYASSRFICLLAAAALFRLSGVMPLLCPSALCQTLRLQLFHKTLLGIGQFCSLLITACLHAVAAARTITLPPATMRLARIRDACVNKRAG